MDAKQLEQIKIKTNESLKECPSSFGKVIVEKIDLDTIGSFFLHKKTGRVDDQTEIVAKRGQADQNELDNPRILCIECGGSGMIGSGNFDHHNCEINRSASLQTLKTLPKDKLSLELIHLTNYIDDFDLCGINKFHEKHSKPQFPGLSDIIAGINLVHSRDPKKALLEGNKVLENIVENKIDPFGQINGFEQYAEAKRTNDEAIEKVRANVQFIDSAKGLKIGFLKTEYFGAPTVVYQEGAKKYGQGETIAVIAHNPAFGQAKNENKFTVGLNLSPAEANQKNLKLNDLAKLLNDMDLAVDNYQQKTWGGPATGTIIGSPKGGSALSLEQVLEVFINNY